MKSRYLLIVLLFALAGCSLGPQPLQMMGAVRAPISLNAVRVYFSQCRPARYETVAKLDASKLGIFSSYDFNLKWLGELRRQAADVGANGILLRQTGGAQTWGSVRHGPVFKAQAIRAPPTAAPTAGTSIWGASCTSLAKLLRYRTLNEVPGYPGVGRVGEGGRSGGR